jgi:hypothetical protein
MRYQLTDHERVAIKPMLPNKPRGVAFGAVLGKALRSLTEGRGLVPILVALQ